MAEKFYKIHTVRLHEIDEQNNLKKIEISRYFQETFALYCKKYSVTAYDVLKQNLMWVLADMHIEFTSDMPFWGEDIRVEIWISELTKLKIYADFRIFHNGTEIAKGDSLWFILDITSRRPINPTELLKPMGVTPECVFGSHEKFNIKQDGELKFSKIYKVGHSELDFNHHMNNISYAMIAVNTIPHDVLKSLTLKSYKIKFIKECFLDDEISSEFYENGEHSYFILKRISDNEIVCQVETEIVYDQIPCLK